MVRKRRMVQSPHLCHSGIAAFDENLPARPLGGMVVRAISHPWLILGVGLQASFFFVYLVLLSREDVSLVLPLTAIDYIVVAVLAHYMLGEVVTPVRWTGMGLIVAGVGLLSRTT